MPAVDVAARSPTARRRRRRGPALVVLALLVVLGGACQVQVAVDTAVAQDGSGTVTVSVGLDAEAMARVGDLDAQLQVDDLRQAGWTVTGPEAGADGVTWVRASKPFSSPDQLPAVLAEVAGPDRLFRDVAFTRTETDDDITYRVAGEVDLTGGLGTFGEPELAALLGGDPFGGNVAAIEAAEGRPVSEMVDVSITTSVAGGTSQTVRPTLADTAPVAIDAAAVEVKPPPVLIRVAIGAGVIAALAVVVVALVGVRRRMRAEH